MVRPRPVLIIQRRALEPSAQKVAYTAFLSRGRRMHEQVCPCLRIPEPEQRFQRSRGGAARLIRAALRDADEQTLGPHVRRRQVPRESLARPRVPREAPKE